MQLISTIPQFESIRKNLSKDLSPMVTFAYITGWRIYTEVMPLRWQPDDFRRHCKRAWARLIRKVWAADPLACPKCGRPLRIISFIENPAVIEKILRHLKIWDSPERPPPPKVSTTLETDADFLAWEAAGRLFDGID